MADLVELFCGGRKKKKIQEGGRKKGEVSENS